MVAEIDKKYFLFGGVLKSARRLVSYLLFEGRQVTTRGRWINPFVWLWLKILMHLPVAPADKGPIFIMGLGRSGTTVLGKIMSVHKEVGFLNEPKLLWYVANPLDDLVGNYSNFGGRFRFSIDELSNTGIYVNRIYSWYLRFIFSKRVVDKYPEMIFRAKALCHIFPESKMILLARNGWDASFSIDRWSQSKGRILGDEVENWWGLNDIKWKNLVSEIIPEHHDLAAYLERINLIKNHKERAVIEWIVSMREIIAVQKRYPHNCMLVHYENLTKNPADLLEEIRVFCDLSPDEAYLSYGVVELEFSKQKSQFDIPDFLQQPFFETMRNLGYDC